MKKNNPETKKFINSSLLIIFLMFVSVSLSFAQKADDNFSGNWISEQGPLVQITKSGDTFNGINVEHNKLVLENLKYNGSEWTGTLIKPKDGSKYDCTALLEGNKLNLTVKKGLFSKTIVWTKQ